MTLLQTVDVDLGPRSYPIHIGKGLLGRAVGLMPFGAGNRSFFILADSKISNTHIPALREALEKGGARHVHVREIPSGEKSKSWRELESTVLWLLDNRADRQSVLVSAGGGMTGDLGGFAASVTMRGIPFIQVPTTLLAQVDSAVGGKTGINTAQGKNLVGAFYQPACVISDLDTLATLPRRELLAGYAEIVKYGLIGDSGFFAWLETNGSKVCALDPEALAKAIAVSCQKKAEIVARDEKEQGLRALLNFGHTFGHALEAAAGYDGGLLHGEAVAIGMVMALRLSVRLGLCPPEDADRAEKHLAAMGLPVRSPAFPMDKVMEHMKHDKKALDGEAVFVLSHGIGKAAVHKDVPVAEARQVIIESMKGS